MDKKFDKSAFSIVASDCGRSILLTKRKDVPVWVLPGGGVEKDENPEDAARREVLEETGLTVKTLRCCGHYTPTNKLAKETYVFVSMPISGELAITDETSDIAYFALEDLPKNFFFLHRDWVLDWQHSGGVLVTKEISQITYCQLCKYLVKHPYIFFRFLWTIITKN